MNIAKIKKSGDQCSFLQNKIQWKTKLNIKDGEYKVGIRPHNITTYKEGNNTLEIKGKVLISEISGSESLIHFTDWNDGGAYALLGPSGCGKTTLLNIISGLITPTEGDILFDDKVVSGLNPVERNIAQIFQFPVIYDTMTVYDNLAFPLRNRKIPEEEIKAKVHEIAEMLELSSTLNNRASGLTADGKQKISLGRGLVRSDVNAIMFDEPLTVIDPHLKWILRSKLKELHQKINRTMIYVTHDQEEALAISDKVIVMNNAVIAQEGSPKDLYNFPRNKFVANFIGDANVVKAEVINKNSNSYDIKIAEMNIKIQSDNELNGDISVALRPEKISIDRNKGENCIQATVNNASFVGSSYQYILNSNVGKLYVVSGDTNDIFKVGEEVFLSINEQEVKILND